MIFLWDIAFLWVTADIIITLCSHRHIKISSKIQLAYSLIQIISACPWFLPVLFPTKFCMLFYHIINNWTIILSDIHYVRGLQFLWYFWKLKFLSKIVEVFEIIRVLINGVSNVFVTQSVADSWLFCNSFQLIGFTCKKASISVNIVKNLLPWIFLYCL